MLIQLCETKQLQISDALHQISLACRDLRKTLRNNEREFGDEWFVQFNAIHKRGAKENEILILYRIEIHIEGGITYTGTHNKQIAWLFDPHDNLDVILMMKDYVEAVLEKIKEFTDAKELKD